MSGGIFVSYRRDDAKHAAGRLVDRLEKSFSRDQLFFDIDNIEPGVDFVRVLKEQVQRCDVLLAVIGPGWVDSRDASGARRLDSPKDFVRIEVEAALARDIRVIPVLVDGARMPSEDELPLSLRPLINRNAVRLVHERFASDTEDLARALKKAVTPPRRVWFGDIISRNKRAELADFDVSEGSPSDLLSTAEPTTAQQRNQHLTEVAGSTDLEAKKPKSAASESSAPLAIATAIMTASTLALQVSGYMEYSMFDYFDISRVFALGALLQLLAAFSGSRAFKATSILLVLAAAGSILFTGYFARDLSIIEGWATSASFGVIAVGLVWSHFLLRWLFRRKFQPKS